MATHFTWNGPAAKKHIEAEMRKRLAAAAVAIQNRTKVLLSVEGTGVRASTTTVGGKKRRKGSLIYGANPSRPGQPPRLQTGRLRASIAWEIEDMVARIGTNIIYAAPLELRLNRIFLRRALEEKAAEVEAILSRPIDF